MTVTGTALVVGIAVIILLAVLFVAAVVSIVRTPMSRDRAAVWLLVCLILQFFGPVAWFVWGRRQAAAA